MFEIFIKPLNFREFLRFKKLDYYLDDVEIYKEKIISEFEKYVFRQFIDIIDFSNEEIFEYINSLTNKIIKEDIASYFKIDYPDILLRIFKIISSSP
jgi:predicted AAA+ superfamily ATPase